MRLSHPLLQLPIRFAAEKLAEEARALPLSALMPHPTDFAGNDAVPLISPNGGLIDAFEAFPVPIPA